MLNNIFTILLLGFVVSCSVNPNHSYPNENYNNKVVPVAPPVYSNEPTYSAPRYYPPKNRPSKRLAPISPPVRSRNPVYSSPSYQSPKNRPSKRLAPTSPANRNSPQKYLKPPTGSNYRSKVPSSVRNYVTKGYASKYQLAENGMKTASGQIYDMYNLTAAHANLPLMSKVVVKNLRNGRTVVVTINDRLHNTNKLIKLSYAAANSLKLLKNTSQLLEIKGL